MPPSLCADLRGDHRCSLVGSSAERGGANDGPRPFVTCHGVNDGEGQAGRGGVNAGGLGGGKGNYDR